MAAKKDNERQGMESTGKPGASAADMGKETKAEVKAEKQLLHGGIGKEIKTQNAKPETVLVQEKPLTPEEEKRRSSLRVLDEAVMRFNMYPVAANEEAKNNALAAMKRIYAEGDGAVKQSTLYVLHEMLCQLSEYRTQKNLEYFRKRFPQNEPAQNRLNVYRAMFNYSGSLEGLGEIVELLADLGDDDSAKVLTHHFSFLCAFDGSEGARMMRNSIVDALGKSNSVYALKALLSYVQNAENEHLGGRIISSIAEWKDKMHGLKIGQKEKDALLKRINEVVMLEREEGHYR